MKRGRVFLWGGGVLLLLAAAGAALAWWHHMNQPAYRLRYGRDLLRKGDWKGAEHLALLLEAAGEADRARLLRGEALLRRDDFAGALEQLNGVRDPGPLRVDAALLTGRCLHGLHRPA